MKKLIFLFSGLLLSLITVNASTTKTTNQTQINSSYNNGYGNSFIFVEDNVEFSLFPDGQFDFLIDKYRKNVSISISTNNTQVSFNSGHNYNAYVQYDEYGAVIQVENTPVFYDDFGRVNQIGSIYINYNAYGTIHQVGGLYVHYRNRQYFSHCTGFINPFNTSYIARPWHMYYRIPAKGFCVIYNSPYRRNYNAVRYQYNRPFVNNSRRRSAVASRRGQTIRRNSVLATRGKGLVRADYSNHRATARTTTPRRNSSVETRTRSNKSNRVSSTTRPKTQRNTRANTPRTRSNKSVKSTPRTRINRVRNKATKTSRTSSQITKRSTKNRVSSPTRSRQTSTRKSSTRTGRRI